MARKMNLDSVRNIMQQRSLITEEHVGKSVALTVQGNGNVIDVKDSEGEFVQSIIEEGTVLRKKIFNCKANSAIAMNNDRNKQLLKDAVAAERAGDANKAHDLFNQYLNKCQLSFGILLPSSKVDQLSDGVEIAAKIVKITTERGSILTLDPATVRAMAPEFAGKTTFNIEDWLDKSDENTEASEQTADAALTEA